MNFSNLKVPKIIEDSIGEWEALNWTPEYIGTLLDTMELRFGSLDGSSDILWENQCKYEKIKSTDISKTLLDVKNLRNSKQIPFVYFGYKDMNNTFGKRDIMNAFSWDTLVLNTIQTRDTSFWLGSLGSYTPCHYDTYGYNIIAQIYGQKLWIMFPPEDTSKLYPTRIPYEESSVFSNVNPLNPDVKNFPNFKGCHPYSTVLSPGQVLYLPRHWWHYVISLTDTTISINTWIPMDSDVEERVKEAFVRVITHSVMSQADLKDFKWLNSADDHMDYNQNLDFLNMALDICEGNVTKSDDGCSHQNCDLNFVEMGDVKCHPNFSTYQIYLEEVRSKYFGFSDPPTESAQGRKSPEIRDLMKDYDFSSSATYRNSVALVNSLVTDEAYLKSSIERYKSMYKPKVDV